MAKKKAKSSKKKKVNTLHLSRLSKKRKKIKNSNPRLRSKNKK